MSNQSALISSNEVAEGTRAFHFTKPEGFVWKAGQSIDLTLIDPLETDAEGNTRAYSIAASPSEAHITIVTRMRDTAFKRVLKNAQPGLAVEIAGPFGSFTLHQKDTRPAIMLVGGIGITPFYSMLKDATERNLPHKIYLFYSNRRPEDTVFLKELTALQATNSNIVFVPTMTDMEKSTQVWQGETGYITRALIEKCALERTDAVYYSAGPAGMVAAMRTLLGEMGVSDDDFRTEEFTGYL